ncbi:ABC transporter substrate-binding protein [Variovorax ginsengisoli]|uniref:Peptide/nickel transport system substrate-binding protein n=1 Tax=Variovorax ginsengisoli TaxID=363844 RepID=A0ABT9S259_9BURK|nr:ABC transporter substrate-binding protein [Variovorax ginsengisoli]MDP9898433.1 peptide/nickel transport system substrate-binding protein [Variovorax ginsengisoli]
MIHRRTLLATGAASLAQLPLLTPLALPLNALAQSRRKDTLVLALTLEPSGLDPTAKAGAEIAEVVLYNVFETLTKINGDGSVTPLLAERWEISPDLRTVTFQLRRGVKFHNGEPFDAQAVKYSFDRAASTDSTNKDKRTFTNLRTQVIDSHTVVLITQEIEPDLLFLLGQASAIIVEPKTVETNATKPVGTGPYRFDSWAKGSTIGLVKWDGFREPEAAQIRKVTFRFISEPAAQVAALLSNDVDLFPHASVSRSLPQFQNDKRFQVLFNASRGKVILAINNKRKPLDDVRVRRAISAAIDRKAVIDAASDGRGVPIGSHYVPGAPGYIDTTGINPYDVEKAKRLLAEAGVKTPLELSLVLPPPPYARQGGEFIAAQLAKIGIVAKIQNVEWAQWISGTYGNKNYDLSVILHVEPFDLVNYTKPDYYWGYQSPRFDKAFSQARNAPTAAERNKYLGEAQRVLAEDAANVFLYQPQLITVAARGLRGLWKDAPIFANDIAAIRWG